MVYNISYDLHSPDQKYDKLKKLIIAVSGDRWSKPLESCYIIKSTKSAEEIYKFLSPALDPDDRILITEITSKYYGFLNNTYWDYIKGLF